MVFTPRWLRNIMVQGNIKFSLVTTMKSLMQLFWGALNNNDKWLFWEILKIMLTIPDQVTQKCNSRFQCEVVLG